MQKARDGPLANKQLTMGKRGLLLYVFGSIQPHPHGIQKLHRRFWERATPSPASPGTVRAG